MLPSIVVAGHICLDVFPDLSKLPPGSINECLQPGHLTVVGPVAFSTGGPVSNTGLVLHKLGIPTRLAAKIGDDPFGQVVRGIVGSFDPKLLGGMVSKPDISTSYTVVISPPGTDRIFLHCPGANDAFGPEDVSVDLLKETSLFHFGYPPLMKRMFADGGNELREVFQIAREAGTTTSLDMAFPDGASEAGRAEWREILTKVLPLVDVFMPSIEETLFLLKRDTYKELVSAAGGGNILSKVSPDLLGDVGRELLSMGAAVVGLKLGDRGLYVRTSEAGRLAAMGRAGVDASTWADREVWSPCFQVKCVGTTGSGDATIAGFLAALVRGSSLLETATAAVAVGACNVEAPDALGGIQTWDSIQRRISAGWPRRSDSAPAGWQTEPGSKVWVNCKGNCAA